MLTVNPSAPMMVVVDGRTASVVAAWLAATGSANTRAAYRRDLEAFARWCGEHGTDLLDATPADVDRFRDEALAAGASPATVTRRLSGIASFFRFASASGDVPVNPVAGVGRPAATRPAAVTLDGAELAALLDAAEAAGPKTAALVGLIGLDGMKLQEVLALDVADVDAEGEAVAVHVRRRGAATTLRLSARTATAVVAHRGDRRDGPLFVGESPGGPHATRLTRFGADFLIKRAAAATGIGKPVSANTLRRAYVVAARRAGTPLAEIADRVGHTSVRQTVRLLARD